MKELFKDAVYEDGHDLIFVEMNGGSVEMRTLARLAMTFGALLLLAGAVMTAIASQPMNLFFILGGAFTLFCGAIFAGIARDRKATVVDPKFSLSEDDTVVRIHRDTGVVEYGLFSSPRPRGTIKDVSFLIWRTSGSHGVIIQRAFYLSMPGGYSNQFFSEAETLDVPFVDMPWEEHPLETFLREQGFPVERAGIGATWRKPKQKN